ncbi:MAG: acyl carrier protein [Acidimicrobiales bacterium]|jgi:acyl carrier protein|nr:acyl carrier protein [Acidimicrobiales bacterium]
MAAFPWADQANLSSLDPQTQQWRKPVSDNFERFKKCAVDVLSVEDSLIVPDATFESLDADSLDLVELVMALEEEFDVNVEEEELEGVTTIQGAFSLVESKL